MDEVSQAQIQLGKALDRARAGEDRALAGRVRDDGARLVNLVCGVLGMARLHTLDNRAFDRPIQDLKQVLDGLIETLGVIHMLAVEEQIYVNDIRIRLEGRGDVVTDLGSQLRRHGVGGLSWHGRLTTEQLRQLTALLVSSPSGEHPRTTLQTAFQTAGLVSIELVGIHRFRLSGEQEQVRRRDLITIEERGSSMLDETWSNLAAKRIPNPLPLRRLVTDILDASSDVSNCWLSPQGASDYAAHTLRVGKLALLIGRELGLPAGALQDLGVAAMYHDVGYAALQPEMADEDAFNRHSQVGACVLIRQRGFHEAKVRRVLATLDHHRRFDDASQKPSLFGRILAIAEDYDILVQPRGAGMAPPEALARMTAEAGAVYDGVLLQILVNVLGGLPPGTLLRLADGRIARVVSGARSAESFEQPVVRIERLSDGVAPSTTIEIDLARPESPRVAEVLLEQAVAHAVDQGADDSRQPGGLSHSNEEQAQGIPEDSTGPAPQDASVLAGPAQGTPATKKQTVVEEFEGKGEQLVEEGDFGSARPLTLGLLPKVFGEVYRRRRTGTLGLMRKDERRSVRFWKGNVVRAASNVKTEQLGEVAVRAGLLRPEDLLRATEIVKRDNNKKRLGLVLMELGVVTEEQLGKALSAHIRGVLEQPCKWADGFYSFEEQQPDASWSEEVAFMLSTPDLILDAVRCVKDPDVIHYLLGDMGRPLIISRDPLTQSAVSSLGPLDGYVLSRVDGRLTAREIIDIIPEDLSQVECSLYGLLCIGLLGYQKTGKEFPLT